jgi:putative transposase
MQYRRARTKDETYFFTVVTYKRKAMLTHRENVSLLREASRHVMGNHPVAIHAFVFLQNHLAGFFRDFYGLKD